ncbi:MAG: hypothetical protein WDZ76_14525 [Pseudohongiellaceae bacterium]
MKLQDLVLRCYAESKGGQWQAICIDLNLAAQADSFEEAREKLEAQISDYLYGALVGEDRKYAEVLIPRRAPLKYRVKYNFLRALTHFNHHVNRAFRMPMPMVPAKTG